MEYTYDVFISYSRKDTKIVNKICEAFDANGITYFIDRSGIGGGLEFPAVLANAIKSSKLFLFIASKNSYVSKFTQSEVVFAFNRKEKGEIIPYIIDGSSLPEELELTFSAINWRNIKDHPIETILINDISSKLDRAQKSFNADYIKCPHCNRQHSATAMFCEYTGKRLTEVVERKQEEQSGRFTANGVSFTMIPVQGGTYQMGASADDDEANDDEKPRHIETVGNFMIGETPVTQALWQAVMGSNPSYFTGDMQRPVETVSWDDCQTFIRKLNQLTGENFRLPTEAEWEYAARGGNKSRGYKYSGSNNADDVAWYYNNSDETTHRVKTKQPNELGIYDMSGNVLEWCQDEWCDDYYSPRNSGDRVLRGGSWVINAGGVRVSNRGGSSPGCRFSNRGLRLAF